MEFDLDNNDNNGYILSYFDCSFNKIVWIEPIQRCKSCRSGICKGCDDVIVQKRIWKQVKVPSSQHTSVLSYATASTKSLNSQFVNWNQSSNNPTPSVQKVYVPTRGNSTKSTVTSLRPGALSAGGEGIDIKHNSYARYFSRINAANSLACSNSSSSNTSVEPIYGNKTMNYGVLSFKWTSDDDII